MLNNFEMKTFLKKFHSRFMTFSLLCFVLFTAQLTSAFASSFAFQEFFTCPSVNESEFFSKSIDSESLHANNISIKVAWHNQQSLPNLVLDEVSISNIFLHIREVYQTYIPTKFPTNFVLTQLRLPNDLGALYCPNQNHSFSTMNIYVDPIGFSNSSQLHRIIAHELLHHFFEFELYAQPIWLEEGLAYALEYFVTGSLSGAPIAEHLNIPWTSIFELPLNTPKARAVSSRNGHMQLLLIYMQKHLGAQAIKDLLATSKKGIDALKEISQKYATPLWPNFESLFKDFQIAKWTNKKNYRGPEHLRDLHFLFSSSKKAQLLEKCPTPLPPWSSCKDKETQKIQIHFE